MAESSMIFTCTLYMPPGEIRLNRKSTKTGRISKHWREARQAIIRDLIHEFYGRATFRGDVRVAVDQHWPEDGDIDAIDKGLFDALAKARVILDDDQITISFTRKFRNSKTPRIEISVQPA